MPSGDAADAGDAAEGAEAPPGDAARTTEERREELDRELDESLAELDRVLLREKEVVAEHRPEGASGSRSGAAPAGGAGSSGGEGGAASDAGDDGGSSGPAEGNVGGASPGSGKPPAGAERDPRVPADVPDGSDDDIVARQLREAAMNEDDPELREKLWDEYRAYKSGQRRAREKKQEDGDEGEDD